MSSVKVVLNRSAVSELLKSQAMMDMCKEVAQSVSDRAGEGYEMNAFVGYDRVHVIVQASSDEAIQDNLDNNTLLKEMHG